ncbi:MAG TPA: hypothetical protein VFY83_10795, partial [Anaerolineales bacterium]|nr:hypothetical protein [Anaerolineales bacterium]
TAAAAASTTISPESIITRLASLPEEISRAAEAYDKLNTRYQRRLVLISIQALNTEVVPGKSNEQTRRLAIKQACMCNRRFRELHHKVKAAYRELRELESLQTNYRLMAQMSLIK